VAAINDCSAFSPRRGRKGQQGSDIVFAGCRWVWGVSYSNLRDIGLTPSLRRAERRKVDNSRGTQPLCGPTASIVPGFRAGGYGDADVFLCASFTSAVECKGDDYQRLHYTDGFSRVILGRKSEKGAGPPRRTRGGFVRALMFLYWRIVPMILYGSRLLPRIRPGAPTKQVRWACLPAARRDQLGELRLSWRLGRTRPRAGALCSWHPAGSSCSPSRPGTFLKNSCLSIAILGGSGSCSMSGCTDEISVTSPLSPLVLDQPVRSFSELDRGARLTVRGVQSVRLPLQGDRKTLGSVLCWFRRDYIIGSKASTTEHHVGRAFRPIPVVVGVALVFRAGTHRQPGGLVPRRIPGAGRPFRTDADDNDQHLLVFARSRRGLLGPSTPWRLPLVDGGVMALSTSSVCWNAHGMRPFGRGLRVSDPSSGPAQAPAACNDNLLRLVPWLSKRV